MKVVARTKWEYYVANIVGIVVIFALLFWFSSRAITSSGIDFGSAYLWLALLLLGLLPFTFISFFSSMKEVEATDKGITISYVFQNHKNVFTFSEVSKLVSSIAPGKKAGTFAQDTFRLMLTDGRVFEFSRAQFKHYDQLKAFCRKIKNNDKIR